MILHKAQGPGGFQVRGVGSQFSPYLLSHSIWEQFSSWE